MRLAMPSLKIQGGFIRFYTARGVLEAGGGDNDVDRVSSFFFVIVFRRRRRSVNKSYLARDGKGSIKRRVEGTYSSSSAQDRYKR